MRKNRLEVPTWRQFEQLVARIEELVAPAGAVVTSPDHIRSVVSGKRREVDASIRLSAGDADTLITIECRRRRPKQDITWIEQLATKRIAIGAARTIAVTVTGFSAQAVQVAPRYGIELRTLADIDATTARGWLSRLESFTHIYNQCRLLDVRICVAGARSAAAPSLDPSVQALLDEFGNADAPIFVAANGKGVTPNALWLAAQSENDVFAGVVPGDPSVQRRLTIRPPHGSLQIRTVDGLRDLVALDLVLELSRGIEEIPLSDARSSEYCDPRGALQHRAEFQTREAQTNLVVAFQGSPEGSAVRASIEFIDPS